VVLIIHTHTHTSGSLLKITYPEYARFEVLIAMFMYLVLCIGREKLNDTDLQFGINLDCGQKVTNYKIVAHYAGHANRLASVKYLAYFMSYILNSYA
jgi:hypothetical protein